MILDPPQFVWLLPIIACCANSAFELERPPQIPKDPPVRACTKFFKAGKVTVQ